MSNLERLEETIRNQKSFNLPNIRNEKSDRPMEKPSVLPSMTRNKTQIFTSKEQMLEPTNLSKFSLSENTSGLSELIWVTECIYNIIITV